ncbi:hypothetical protein RCL1_002086 [Eukaryota sp. TZLM3-RCL]
MNVDLFSRFGQTLTPQQKLTLDVSLPTIKQDYRLPKVQFWGRISGLRSDYLIAEGLCENLKPLFFFSLDGLQWAELPSFYPGLAEQVLLIRDPFRGDPTYSYKIFSETISEAVRLSIVVHQIALDTSVVPRGAYKQTVDSRIVKNKLFEGIPVDDVTKLSSFLHRSKSLPHFDPTEIAEMGLDVVIDCLEPLSNDIPTESWSINFSTHESLVIIRSLLWLGYAFFHHVEDTWYGGVYFGDGVRNNDLLFMLN